MVASLERIRMAFKANERVEAETPGNPEMFVRSSLGDFSGKGMRHGEPVAPWSGSKARPDRTRDSRALSGARGYSGC
jgi:hypothetical protein